LNVGQSQAPNALSHADQQAEWQTGWPTVRGERGWGGRLADLPTHRSTTLYQFILD